MCNLFTQILQGLLRAFQGARADGKTGAAVQ